MTTPRPKPTPDQLAISRQKRALARAAWREADAWDQQIGLTIVLEVEGLDLLELVAWMHDGESEDYFVANALPTLANYTQAELWALAGMFLSHRFAAGDPLDVAAQFIAHYASLVQALEPCDLRPDPLAAWADWRFRSAEGGAPTPPFAWIAEGVALALTSHIDALWDDDQR